MDEGVGLLDVSVATELVVLLVIEEELEVALEDEVLVMLLLEADELVVEADEDVADAEDGAGAFGHSCEGPMPEAKAVMMLVPC